MRITVFHNIATDMLARRIAMLDGYVPGHPLVPVHQYEMAKAANPFTMANIMYRVFNVGDDPDMGITDPQAVLYRQRKNRSLSVGDVLHIGGGTTEGDTLAAEVWLACASVGWEAVMAPLYICRDATTHGTTPLPRDVQLGI